MFASPAATSLLLALALGIAPAASPSPPPASGSTPPLKLIVRIRATNRCAKIAVHSNGAINAALRADQTLATTISALRTVDLDSNGLTRDRGLRRLGDLGSSIALQVRRGNQEISNLRALAAKETDPAAKKTLLAFANSLGGAIYRQKKMGRDLDGFVAQMYAKSMYHVDESQENMALAVFSLRAPTPMQGTGMFSIDSAPDRLGGDPVSRPFVNQSDNQTANFVAQNFSQRQVNVTNDEATAAHAILAVSGGC
ncbi:MAG: hypothetical protein ACYDA1_02290 [Vulcanimicrobiaceae bacterium]